MRLFLGLLCACSPPPAPPDPATEPDLPTLSTPPHPLRVGLAGAPVELFGSVDAPDFSVLEALGSAGFTDFFPLFLTSEVDGIAETTGHLVYFLEPDLFGLEPALSCAGPSDPYAAASGHLQILFPGFLLLDPNPAAPLDDAAFRTRLAAQRDVCWADHPGVISAFYSRDEPALYAVAADFAGDPAPDLPAMAAAHETAVEVLGLPTMVVEGPGPLALEEAGLTGADLNASLDVFWGAVDAIAPTVDAFGFDVYPVPDHSLNLPGDYVLEARQRAPSADLVSVLQGFGYGQTTGGVRPGRVPTLAETRFMAFDSVALGADTVIWYGQSALDLAQPDEAQLWEDILTVGSEVATIREISVWEALEAEQEGFGVRVHRDVGGRTIGIVTRRAAGAGTFSWSSDEPLSGGVSLLGPNVSIDGDTLTVDLLEHEVVVFELAP